MRAPEMIKEENLFALQNFGVVHGERFAFAYVRVGLNLLMTGAVFRLLGF